MAWHHVEDVVTRAPQYATRTVPVTKRSTTGYPYVMNVEQSTRNPTGEIIEWHHSIWRCGLCRALACGPQGEKPDGNCGKCGSRG